MAKAKRKTLPKDFEALLLEADFAKLTAALEACEPNARGILGQRALAFKACSDELSRWLVARGADVDAPDDYDSTPLQSRIRCYGSIDVLLELGADVHRVGGSGTPLHTAAGKHWKDAVVKLLAAGAKVDAPGTRGQTPLEFALQGATSAYLPQLVEVVHVLLEAGAEKRPSVHAAVKRVGEQFEFHRQGFEKKLRPAASQALKELYALFEVQPVAARVMHDGAAPIVATAPTWGKRHKQLWDLLVPSRGPAKTIQGEVIRISGRIGDEIHRNGGCNWGSSYRAMGRAFVELIQTGVSLSVDDVKRTRGILRGMPDAEETAVLAELAVRWVESNPAPVPLPPQSYER